MSSDTPNWKGTNGFIIKQQQQNNQKKTQTTTLIFGVFSLGFQNR
ncbi:MAG: hypothetical protein Q8P67_25245 [archaeon]|nr:hypothetical protein [archaeon]